MLGTISIVINRCWGGTESPGSLFKADQWLRSDQHQLEITSSVHLTLKGTWSHILCQGEMKTFTNDLSLVLLPQSHSWPSCFGWLQSAQCTVSLTAQVLSMYKVQIHLFYLPSVLVSQSGSRHHVYAPWMPPLAKAMRKSNRRLWEKIMYQKSEWCLLFVQLKRVAF